MIDLRELFAPAPGSRPAVLAGLVTGVAVGCPLVVGVLLARDVDGALACLGAYVTAFTNKGGPRPARTVGLLVAATVNGAAYLVGSVVANLFLLALVVLAILVFLAGMGDAASRTAARLGTMPATALLAGAGGIVGGPGVIGSAVLVFCGGVWYAAATALLTPAPRLRGVLAAVVEPYAATRHSLALLTGPAGLPEPGGSARGAAALRRAEEAANALPALGGDEDLSVLVDPLLREAATLIDLTAALGATGRPHPDVAPQVAAAVRALVQRLAEVEQVVVRRATRRTGDDVPHALAALSVACSRLRAEAAADRVPYADVLRAGRQRRLLDRIAAAAARARSAADAVRGAAATILPEVPARPGWRGVRHLATAMTLGSPRYRHALRVTAVSATVFTAVWALDLPHGEWATLAVLRVLQPAYADTARRAGQRIVGNLVGGTCAALLIATVSAPAALSVVLFVIIAAGFTLRPVNYAAWVVFGTPLVLLIGDIADPGDWRTALARIAMTVIGSVAALLGGYLLWPTWERDRLGERVDEAVRASAAALDAVLGALEEPGRADGPGQARRAAHEALATAEGAVGDARHEPGDPTGTDPSRATVDALRSLHTTLAALSVHASPGSARLPGLEEYASRASRVLTADSRQERTAHVVALAELLDGMQMHLDCLQARRVGELALRLDVDTPVRAAIRAAAPVVDLLGALTRDLEVLDGLRR